MLPSTITFGSSWRPAISSAVISFPVKTLLYLYKAFGGFFFKFSSTLFTNLPSGVSLLKSNLFPLKSTAYTFSYLPSLETSNFSRPKEFMYTRTNFSHPLISASFRFANPPALKSIVSSSAQPDIFNFSKVFGKFLPFTSFTFVPVKTSPFKFSSFSRPVRSFTSRFVKSSSPSYFTASSKEAAPVCSLTAFKRASSGITMLSNGSISTNSLAALSSFTLSVWIVILSVCASSFAKALTLSSTGLNVSQLSFE